MPGKYLFEYAVIRIVPRVEREEFLNAGVVVYCAKRNFLKIRFRINEKRISAFCESACIEEIREHLVAFEKICAADKDAGPIAKLPIAERFRWLTATRSTVVQASKVHPGFCDDPDEKLDQLFTQLVD
jgi:hypothetical protein